MLDSFEVIRTYPKLMVFPFIAGVASLIFFVAIFFPLVFAGLLTNGLEFVVVFLLYVGTTFISTYFAAALVYGANKALHGENPHLFECVMAVRDQLWPILVWSVIAGTVSLLLRMAEDRNNLLAAILQAVFATAWSIMTFFIVPVIVFEDVTVKSMFKRSGSVFLDTWGETLGSGFGITLVTMGIGAGLLVLAGAVAFTVSTVSPGPGIFFGLLLVVGVFVFTYLLGQTVWGIAKTALYLYATEGTHPDQFRNFDFATLDGRTKAKRTRT